MLRLHAVSSLSSVLVLAALAGGAAGCANVAGPDGPRPVFTPPSGPGANDPGDDAPVTGVVDDAPRRFTVQLTNVAPWTLAKSGIFDVPVGKAGPGPLHPGEAYEVTFTAGKHHRVSFAMMLGASNDWFYGSPEDGIPLYDDDGTPLAQDVTSQVRLYDAGTEIDEEPAVGAHTGPRQSAPDDGPADPNAFVRAIQSPVLLTDGTFFTLPSVSSVLQVTLTPVGERTFRLRIENCSHPGALQTSQGAKDIVLSPGVYAVAGGGQPLFTTGEADRGQGLERIAEAGQVSLLASALAEESGVATPFSPGLYVVHSEGEPLFTVGQPDRGLGLERIAESGDVSVLDDALGTAFPEGASLKALFNTVDGGDAAGPLRPGDTYTFSFEARPGDRLSFASMFGASNDWIVATHADGLALFDDKGNALSGDHTADLGFYDVGTEVDEEPGVGAHTGPNQSAPDDGPADPVDMVRPLSPTVYPFPVAAHLQLTITATAL